MNAIFYYVVFNFACTGYDFKTFSSARGKGKQELVFRERTVKDFNVDGETDFKDRP